MSNELRDQTYNELNLRETDDLLEIWHTTDHEEWTDIGLEVIRDILIERLGEIPPREDIIEDTQGEKDPLKDGELEEWEAKALDNEDQPEFYNVVDVILLKKNIDKTAKAVIVVYILTSIASFQWFSSLIWPIFQNRPEFTLLVYIIAFIFMGLSTVFTIAITYFPLKALTHILRILMEMEFRSRKTG